MPAWDDGKAPAFPALTGDIEADACVVGLGGSGLAAIDELLSLGGSVVGVDAGVVAGAAAGRNGGLLRAGLALFHHEARARLGPLATRLYAATRDERESLAARLPGLVRRSGYIRLAVDREEEQDCRAHLEALRADGFPAEWTETPLGAGLRVPDDACVNPMARCRAEAGLVVRGGARLFEHSPVVGFRPGCVETERGRIRCRAVVVAVDGALARLLPELEDRVRPARLQMLSSSAVPDELPVAGASRWGWDYWQRLDDGSIAFGGCRDDGGPAEWTDATEPTGAVQSALERRLAALTRVPVVVTHRWAATVGYTDDAVPVLAEVRPGVWATGGYSGTGNLLGAVCGRAAARLATGTTTASLLD